MQHHAADKLHIIMNHIPLYFGTSRHPRRIIISLIPNNIDAFESGGQITIHSRGSNFHFIVVGKPFGCFFYHGKSFRKNIIQYFLGFLINLFFQPVDFQINLFFIINRYRFIIFSFFFQHSHLLFVFVHIFINAFTKLRGFGPEAII